MKFCKFLPIKCDLDKCDKRTAHYRASRLFNVKFGIIPGSGGVVTTLINKVMKTRSLANFSHGSAGINAYKCY